MPDKYIIYREDSKNNGTVAWSNLLKTLSTVQKNDFLRIVNLNRFGDGSETSQYSEVNALLAHYRKGKAHLAEEDSGL